MTLYCFQKLIHFPQINTIYDSSYAHNSHNEQILGQAVASFDAASRAQTRGGGGSSDKPPPLHVVTKVWYSHLGYERTKISVQESLDQLASKNTRQVYVHMLLHWARCNDEIEWMNCEEEENNIFNHKCV